MKRKPFTTVIATRPIRSPALQRLQASDRGTLRPSVRNSRPRGDGDTHAPAASPLLLQGEVRRSSRPPGKQRHCANICVSSSASSVHRAKWQRGTRCGQSRKPVLRRRRSRIISCLVCVHPAKQPVHNNRDRHRTRRYQNAGKGKQEKAEPRHT